MDRDSRLPALTGLRWAAAMAVFGHHLLEQFLEPHAAIPPAVRTAAWALQVNAGALGVSFFFVLSGFVLAWSARPTGGPATFLWRRFTKIYPATLVTTLVAVVVVGVPAPVALGSHLTLTQAWFPDAGVYNALNPVSWSLSGEAFFYLCFPLLLPALRRLRTPALWTLAAVLVGFVLAVGAALTAFDRPVGLWLGYLFPPVRLAEFVLGIVLALLVRAGAWRGPGLGWSFVLLAPAAAGAVVAPFPLSQHALTLAPVALIVAAAARCDVRGERTFWSRPLCGYLGELSFAFYLVHYLVFVAFERTGMLPEHADPLVAVLAAVSVFSFSVLAAMLLYHGVELPALRVLRGGRRGRHRPPARIATRPAPTRPATIQPATIQPATIPVTAVAAATGGPGRPVSPSMR